MSSLSLKHVVKAYPNGFVAVKDFNLDIRDGEFIVFAGPSGCGKSTVLRMIAGLEDVTSGEVWLDEKLVNDVEPGDREIAMLFKNSMLYPDLTVYGNLAFGLRLRHMPEAEIDQRVREAAEVTGLTGLLDKSPEGLSGLERLRVALGRLVVRRPGMLLMDEPLSSLEQELQGQMQEEISRLHQELGLTIVYVARDQAEACGLGTRIVLMKDGAVQQADTMENLYNRPCNVFVAGYLGEPQMNRVDALAEKSSQGVMLTVGTESLLLPQEKGRVLEEQDYLGRTVVLGIRPEHLRVAGKEEDVGCLVFDAEVLEREEASGKVWLHFRMVDVEWIVCAEDGSQAEAGDTLRLALDARWIHIFDKDTRQALVH